jgi:exonuclease VII small subunit
MKRRALFALAFAAALPAAAQTLYKLIDKNGKVTYSDTPPKDFDGKVVPMEVDPNRNRATLTNPGDAQRALADKARASNAADDELKRAQERLEAARRSLADARENPREGEVERVGNVGGGARPVPTEAYEKRLAALEEAVRSAEEEVRRAQKAR